MFATPPARPYALWPSPSYGHPQGSPPPRPPQPLTSARATPAAAACPALPADVRRHIVSGRCGAVRAWRMYRGVRVTTIMETLRLSPATFEAIDQGEVALCEWTAAVIAAALHIEPAELLQAEMLAAMRRSPLA